MTLESETARSFERSRSKKNKQLIAVGVLSLMLVGILLWPSQSDADPRATPSLTIRPVSKSSSNRRVNQLTQSETDFSRKNNFSSLDSDALFGVDLFRGPDAPVTESLESFAQPAAPTPYAVGAVYGNIDSTNQSALIDGDIVRSGDLLRGESRVLSISTEGVTLSK